MSTTDPLTLHSLLAYWHAVADTWNFGSAGAKADVSGPSHFIANAHNELYTFYTGKGDLLKK